MIVDATSTVENVTFERPGGKGAGLALADPLSVKGFIKGLAVNDFIQFGGTNSGTSVDVKSFQLTNNQHDLTITYNNNQHATFHLTAMQANTTFKLTEGAVESTLTVVKIVGVADVQHDFQIV
jgi:hypothetical protein